MLGRLGRKSGFQIGLSSPATVVRSPIAPEKAPGKTATTREELLVSLRNGRIVRVDDAGLGNALSALIQHHVGLGVFDLSARDLQIRPADDHEIAHVPHRNEALSSQTEMRGCTCVLCAPPNPEQTGLSWRSYTIWPNIFPYVPVETTPVVITSSMHRDQELNTSILEDMLAYQRWAARPNEPIRMFYHGVAGNSEAHLHWHGTSHITPLERNLDRGLIPTRSCFKTDVGTVKIFESKDASGFLVEGSDSFVSAMTVDLARRIEGDQSAGAYNLLLLAAKGHHSRMVVFPRRLMPDDSDAPRAGALDLAGSYLNLDKQIPDGVAEQKRTINRLHSAPVSDLGWVGDLEKNWGTSLIEARRR